MEVLGDIIVVCLFWFFVAEILERF